MGMVFPNNLTKIINQSAQHTIGKSLIFSFEKPYFDMAEQTGNRRI
jgi:hypothetical protein